MIKMVNFFIERNAYNFIENAWVDIEVNAYAMPNDHGPTNY